MLKRYLSVILGVKRYLEKCVHVLSGEEVTTGVTLAGGSVEGDTQQIHKRLKIPNCGWFCLRHAVACIAVHRE